jgi:hypothetical protein
VAAIFYVGYVGASLQKRKHDIKKGGSGMKKKIIIWVFSALILMTAIYFITVATLSYKADLTSGVDIMEGMGAAILIVIGGFVVFYELDLFYTVYYFLVKPKTITKSILNILSNVSLMLVFVSGYIADFLCQYISDIEGVIVPIVIFSIYLLLRIVYLMASTCSLNEEEQRTVH